MRVRHIFLGTSKLVPVLIFFTAVTCLFGFRPASAAVVGLDAVHYYESYPWGRKNYRLWKDETGGGNYNSLRRLISDPELGLGHEIVPLREFNADELAGVDVAVFLISTIGRLNPDGSRDFGDGIPYTDDQIAAIQAFALKGAVFLSDSTMLSTYIHYENNLKLAENIINHIVESGGGVLFIADNNGDESWACDIDNWNELVAPFGIEYSLPLPDHNYPENIIRDFVEHPITEGVQSIRVLSYPETTIFSPSLDLTVNPSPEDVLAVYDAELGITVFMTPDFSETEGVAGFGFLPGSQITLEVDYENDGSEVYKYTKGLDPDGVVRFFPRDGYFRVKEGSLVRMYYTLNPRVVKEHNVVFMSVDSIMFHGDVLGGRAEPGTQLLVRVFDPEQPFPGGPELVIEAWSNGYWGAYFEGVFDITPSNWGWVIINDEDGDHTQIHWKGVDYLGVDGTLDPNAPVSSYVRDDVYGILAAAGFWNDYWSEWPTEPIDVKIQVFDDGELPPGTPAVEAQGTNLVNIQLDPEPASYPLPPRGLSVVLPLLEPLPVSYWSIELKRVDPDTGELVPAKQWALKCIGDTCPSPYEDPTQWVNLLRDYALCYIISWPSAPCPPGVPPETVCGKRMECPDIASFSTLVGVLPDVITISIDIKPGSTTNPINLKKKGVVPVAILGNSAFDDNMIYIIDPETLSFHGASPKHDLTDPVTFADHLEDVNGDGIMDLVVHFSVQEIKDLEKFSTEGCVEGSTKAGQSFSGCDSVKCK